MSEEEKLQLMHALYYLRMYKNPADINVNLARRHIEKALKIKETKVAEGAEWRMLADRGVANARTNET